MSKSVSDNVNISLISLNSENDCQIVESIVESKIATIEIGDEIYGDQNMHEQSSEILVDDNENLNNYSRSFPTEDNSNSANLLRTNVVFRLAFNSKENFVRLKNIIISSLNMCLKENNLNIELLEDEILLDIAAIDKTIENKEKQPLFIISATPSLTTAENEMRSMVPSYKRAVKDILDIESNSRKLEIIDDSAKPKSTCFNCNGPHQLRDCSLPKNMMKIKKNRKVLKLKSERYHIDIEQRFAHLKPGKLSENLKHSLGLREGELPSFFYRMRVQGYPPGWLEDAKVAHSGIMLFDSEGRAVMGSDDEEGELDATKHKYNVGKIISFPGFNVHPGRGYFDDYRYHRVPPIEGKQSKIKFIQELGDNIAKEGYKRKKFKIPQSVEDPMIDSSSKEPVDMELEEEDGEILGSYFNVAPPLPPDEDIPSPPSIHDREINSKSPTITDLELQQQELLKALNSSEILTELSSSRIGSEISVSEVSGELPLLNKEQLAKPIFETENNTEHLDKSINVVENNTNNIDNDCSLQDTIINNLVDSICSSQTSSTLGTPVLKFSPYDKLPTDDLWRVGVSDVINFENLPDSTGKYTQMKRVLSKVRRKIAKINASDT